MARGNRFFKIQYNRLLDELGTIEVGAVLGSEPELAGRLGASRTTVRAVLAELSDRGIIRWEGREKRLIRPPGPADHFASLETLAPQDYAEDRFLEWICQLDLPPGQAFSETQLARDLDVPIGTLRQFLIRFEPLGLIEKQPNRHWVLKGFTREFATEMFDVREMFERRALGVLMGRELTPDRRNEWESLRHRHEALLSGGDKSLLAFPALDAAFHAAICAAADNRFISDFARTISIIVHYHYRWNKRGDLDRNRAAVGEHLAIVEAVLEGDPASAREALDRHLRTARGTLMTSVSW